MNRYHIAEYHLLQGETGGHCGEKRARAGPSAKDAPQANPGFRKKTFL